MKKRRKDSLTELAEAAFRQAAWKVIERAEQTGTPIIVGEDGVITRIDPKVYRRKLKRRAAAEGW